MTLDYESGGQEFESLRARHFGTRYRRQAPPIPLRFLGTRRRRLGRVIDPVGPNEEVSRNFQCFTQLVDHVDRERAPPSENFGCKRATQ
jgi:hypothetical protein